MSGLGDELHSVWQGNHGDDLDNLREKTLGVRAHRAAHMSPAQAAQAAGVSRWTIMRAIKSQELQAIRDNRNQWRITPDDLDRWCASTVRTPTDLHTSHTPEVVAELRERLSAETVRADAAERARDQAEADRDRWQAMAEKLADRPRRWWWFR